MGKCSFWKYQWADLSLEGYTSDNQYVYVEAQNSSGQIVWTTKIDATGGSCDYMSRSWIEKAKCTEELIFVGTDGEHYKGASSHFVFTHQIDRNGNIIVSTPEQ